MGSCISRGLFQAETSSPLPRGTPLACSQTYIHFVGGGEECLLRRESQVGTREE